MSQDGVTLKIVCLQCEEKFWWTAGKKTSIIIEPIVVPVVFYRILWQHVCEIFVYELEGGRGGSEIINNSVSSWVPFLLFQTSSSSVLSASMSIFRSERYFAHHSVESVCGRIAWNGSTRWQTWWLVGSGIEIYLWWFPAGVKISCHLDILSMITETLAVYTLRLAVMTRANN